MSGERERRLQALERRLAHVLAPADARELWIEIPKHLSFGEIECAQQVLAGYGGDPARAMEAADPTFMALAAIAHARRSGVPIPAMFP